MLKKKTKIVIASVLKPVDDVRNYEKVACSLAKEEMYELFMMGTIGTKNDYDSTIHLLPWPPFQRLSIARFLIQFRYFFQLKKVRPQLVIITTHELLLTSVFYRLFFKTTLVYDVQEDYHRNLQYQHFYPAIVRLPLAQLIRLTEKLCAPFIHHFLLAEAVYEQDIPFVKRCFIIIDNKSLPIQKLEKKGTFKVVFTGTISSYSQAIESIQLFEKIAPSFDNPQLTVIGYCPSARYRKKLVTFQSDVINLILSDKPVPHSQIVHEIATAHLAIIGYSPNPINELKIPTKQYEYTAAQLPYLVRKDTHWSRLGEQLGGAIPVDFDDLDAKKIRTLFDNLDISSIQHAAAEWTENEQKLRETIANILAKY